MRFHARETSRAFAPLPHASRSVFAYIVYIFFAPSSAFEARLVGKSRFSAKQGGSKKILNKG